MKRTMRSYCQACCENRPFEKQSASHVLHLLLSIVTFGVWLPVWFLCALSAGFQPWHCPMCGKLRWLQSSKAEMRMADLP